jgi:hypothetical protein
MPVPSCGARTGTATSPTSSDAGPGERAQLRAEADRIVRANWRAIKRLADVLVERGEMSGDQVCALLSGDWSPRLPAFA